MGTLWLIATPIGNMADLSPRAAEVLGRVALLCCEDTRRTGLLLQRAGIHAPPLAVCNEHTERRCVDRVLAVLDGGDDVGVVSDAGMPAISDPGAGLVTAAIGHGHTVSTVPGPTAFVAALAASGLPTERFAFEGFLPRTGRARQDRVAAIADEARTVVLYEAPHRLLRTLDDLRSACGDDRRITVARELTKMHEEIVRGELGTIDVGTPRGEYVLVLDGRPPIAERAGDDAVERALRDELASGTSTRDAASIVAAATGWKRRDVYQIAIGITGTDDR